MSFRIEGEANSVTLLLDRAPPQLGADGEPAEIEIALTADDAEGFSRGLLPMTAAVISGQVTATGPVRRYLEVDPILRGLLAAVAPQNGWHPPAVAPRTDGYTAPPADLLAIETRDVHKSFGDHKVLAGVDLAIPEGVISVVLGPSGTGKSVLLKHVVGLLPPDSGEVFIRGRALSQMSRSELLALRREIGVMYQDGALFSAMSLYDNVAFPLRQHTSLNEAEIREVVMEHLAAVGLADAGDRVPNQLSGGMKKRAGLARSLVLNPGIVLCDEPDSGLDPVRTALLADLLVEQHTQHGGTMVVVTHNVSLAKHIGDHVSVLWQGRVLEAAMRDELFASPSDFVRQFLAGDTAGPLGMEA
ncbi:MAG: phospholipid/cholesterol/gamma-HCH transport system ATP-binding protein [Thermoleophilaceae bacterium]|nr:phospholipid/cholesterol/gamma-HCH transport system ATP-binding protein [Thermoleophilaceae bacterium]